MDFSGLIPALQTQNIDVALSGMTIKEERRKAIDFSDPYYDSGLAAMVQSGNTSIRSIDDLNGKVIAAKTGTATIDWIKAHLKPKEIRQFPNIDRAYLALEAGRVDAAMHDTPNVLYFASTAGKGKVKVAGTPVSGDKYGIGFPKGSPLVASVNAELAKMKADGRYATLYKSGSAPSRPNRNRCDVPCGSSRRAADAHLRAVRGIRLDSYLGALPDLMRRRGADCIHRLRGLDRRLYRRCRGGHMPRLRPACAKRYCAGFTSN